MKYLNYHENVQLNTLPIIVDIYNKFRAPKYLKNKIK